MKGRILEKNHICKFHLSISVFNIADNRSKVTMADPGKAPVEHCLALKVMRLTRPTIGQATIVQSSGTDIEK